ncbi:MAG: GGDEF domain-containing protein, partial [Rhodanobacter sp.]
ALKYAVQLAPETAAPESRCANYSYKINAQSYVAAIPSQDPELHRAIDVCLADGQAVYANTLQFIRADALNAEGHGDQAIALLKGVMPDILRAGFRSHIADVNVSLARLLTEKGDDAGAKEFALAALAASDPGKFNWPLQSAYELLYEIGKRAGNGREALHYYELYVAQYKAGMDDAKTRALAYQMVKQNVLAKRMKLEALGKQNRILELRQELVVQAQRTSRLWIVLLVVMLVFIAGGMFWLRRSQLRFRRMARHDGLTGAFNREHFFDTARRVLQRLRKTNACVCLAVLDLDYFKQVNDTYGHAAGDEVLRRIVDACRLELRDSDVFGRLGGEEFGVLMPGCSRGQGFEIATRIRRALAATEIVLDPQTRIHVSASVGLACSAHSELTLNQLLREADLALYRAKDTGRNRVNADVASHPAGPEAEQAAGSASPVGFHPMTGSSNCADVECVGSMRSE